MHIPDGFLSPPVWATLDVLSVPAAAWIAHRAQRGAEDRKIPLMGVMGAFVFAAQMINFPIPLGTSGHLVGGALLTIVLGPAAASVAMMAILAIQALVFQDGGIMALGANVTNMALAGVLAAYIPYWAWGARWRSAAIFTSGFLSVLVSACLALSELSISGVPMPKRLLLLSFGLFLISGILEGAITLAAVRAIERLNPRWVSTPFQSGSRMIGAVGTAAVILATVGILIGSAAPEVIEHLAASFGIAAHAPAWMHAPLADYEWKGIESGWLRRASAALTGLALIYGACVIMGRFLARRRFLMRQGSA
ncbi:MAG: energy-coupling factor ABC transporter permease [Bryobacterales bacterium]|nr:energy-coupling factor ABC transporter permease [Bryobacterales bacterium]MBV9396390.1 energy-coupling factor ABC transporter permease [Bryobacterales bacterium]